MKYNFTKIVASLQVFLMLGTPFMTYAATDDTTSIPSLGITVNNQDLKPVENLTTETKVETKTATNSDIANDTIDDEEDDTDLNLGDDNTEQDAKKDFTGIVRQSRDYTCGPASLATLMTQLGNDTNESEILDLITSENLKSEKGTNLLALKIASQKLGNVTFLKRWTAHEILSYITSSSDPVLMHDEKKGVGGHFSVIREYDAVKGIVELSDTEAGNIKYSVKDFEHIYTGEALIINDTDPLGTNITDEEAATIWGKYVPVQVLAANSTNSGLQSAAKVFATCTATALSKTTVALRNTARKLCYEVLAQAIAKNLNNSGEAGFALDYNAASFADGALKLTGLTAGVEKKDLAGQLGETSIITLLQKKLNDNKTSVTSANKIVLDSQVTLKNSNQTDYNKKTLLGGQITSKQAIITTANTQVTLINASVSSKTDTANTLDKQISGGSFVKDNVTYSLGAVGNQVSASSATYSKLSSALSAKLANLDSQIASLNRQISSANSQVNTYVSQANTARSNANSALSQYNYYKTRKGYTSTAQSYYNTYTNELSKASTADSNATYYRNQISSYNSQISSLQNQKTSASTEVNNASAELAKQKRLKDFGDAEMQRLKGLLATLNTDITSLKKQFDTAKANLTKYTNELTQLQSEYAKVSYATPALSSSEITRLNTLITTNQTLVATLTNEIKAQQSEIANEASFEKTLSDNTQVTGTMEVRTLTDRAISYVNNTLNTACLGAAATSWAVVTIPATGAICSTALIAQTPVSLIEGFKGSKLFSQTEIGALERAIDITVGTVGLGVGAKTFIVVSKNAQNIKSIAFVSDGTVEGEALLKSQQGAMESGMKGAGSLSTKFTTWLNTGVAENYVYVGYKNGKAVYVGYTNNLVARQAQHIAVGRVEKIEKIASLLTRNQARSLEQTIINSNNAVIADEWSNSINSIAEGRDIYDDAINWATKFMQNANIGFIYK